MTGKQAEIISRFLGDGVYCEDQIVYPNLEKPRYCIKVDADKWLYLIKGAGSEEVKGVDTLSKAREYILTGKVRD